MIDMSNEIYISEALSNETRLRILLIAQDAALCVKCLVASLKVPQPTVSRHLSIMKKCGLLKREQKATHSYYSVDFSGEYSSLKRKLVLAYQEELKDKEPYLSDRKRFMEYMKCSSDGNCALPISEGGAGKKEKQ